MNMPGFTAEAALGEVRGFRTRRRADRPADGRRRVVAQLKGGVFRPRLGGGLGTFGDYWTCKDSCYRTYDACLAGCEGTWESPKASRNCLICDEDYRRCVSNCSGDIA